MKPSPNTFPDYLNRRSPTALILAFLVVLAGCTAGIDIDGDGLNASVEKKHELKQFDADTDGDGLNDSFEVNDADLDPKNPDSDGDRLTDKQELDNGTNPARPDSDQDGLPDTEELQRQTDPNDPDTDDDGVTDGVEIVHQSSPTTSDTDGDGLPDSAEISRDDLDVTSADTDDDGLSDIRELDLPTHPDNPDSDGDGRPDKLEVNTETDPMNPDTDGDGLEDGFEAPPGDRDRRSDPTLQDTDKDGLNDNLEYQIGTNPTRTDTDGDGRPDAFEHNASDLDPIRQEVQVIDGSPSAGLANSTLRNETLEAVEFLARLPENRTQRNQTIVSAATELCNAHDQVAPDNVSKATGISAETYRNTYRVTHAANVLHDTLGADIDVETISQHMHLARKYGRIASRMAPVAASYDRLHEASCAVKRGEAGSNEDFYVAASIFAVDLVLVQQGVAFKAAFKTTGYVARQVGLMRLARVCGYKCVGLVESELHWALRGEIHGSLGYLTEEAVRGNLTATGYSETVEQDVAKYLEQHDRTVVNGIITNRSTVTQCFESNMGPADLVKLKGELRDILEYMLEHQELPADVDLTLLTTVKAVEKCVAEGG